MSTARPLLIELLTEELPPKALNRLGQAFAQQLRDTLSSLNLLEDACTYQDYATPRRLAVLLSAVRDQAPEQSYSEKLMPAKVGLTDDGQATPALQKKLASKGWEHLSVADLARESDGKQEYLYAKGIAPGMALAEGLQQALDEAITKLPIPKVMQYQLADGSTTVKFVRPAHLLVALWGDQVIPVQALGLHADRLTQGHRFMAPETISLANSDAYVTCLGDTGKVIPSFSQRRENIAGQLAEHARQLQATIGEGPEVDALLDEVTALVEWPVVYVGQFDEGFLSVPPECLILTMRLNQKYFPLFDPATGKLTHRFLIVSNMQVANPHNIVEGNERVVRPRLADAQFFFETDRKQALADRIPALAESVYHNKLGSQLVRAERIAQLARFLAERLGANVSHAERAAQLAKADLNTGMVAEFPELQGIMGAYYAQADGEAPQVVRALRDQYRIRLDQAVNDETLTAAILFMAERAETLVGIWGIGLAPTGERDPYALRRAALGLISAFEQLAAGAYLPVPDDGRLTLDALLQAAADTFDAGLLPASTLEEVRDFIFERYRNQLNTSHDRQSVDAVLALHPALHEVRARIQACEAFAQQPEAASLAAANKRISNLLKKTDEAVGAVDAARLQEPAEQTLAQAIDTLAPQAEAQLRAGDFAASLATLANARQAVDAFFNDVMVMAEDPAVRANRLALLARLHGMMNQVADISRLAT